MSYAAAADREAARCQHAIHAHRPAAGGSVRLEGRRHPQPTHTHNKHKTHPPTKAHLPWPQAGDVAVQVEPAVSVQDEDAQRVSPLDRDVVRLVDGEEPGERRKGGKEGWIKQ